MKFSIRLFILSLLVCSLPFLCADGEVVSAISMQQEEESVVVFAPGLRNNVNEFKDSVVSQVFPDVPLYGKPGAEMVRGFLDVNRAVFGQQKDMDSVIEACKQALQAHKNPKIVGFGFSKGSATWINVLNYLTVSKKPEHKEILAHIKAVVVVAPFADLFESNMLAHTFFTPVTKRLAVPDVFNLGRNIFKALVKKWCPVYDPFGIHPVESIKQFDHNVPLFIAHSLGDDVIPVHHSRLLYKERMRALGEAEKNCYLFEFNGGNHSESLRISTEWYAPMHEFLTLYGVPLCNTSQASNQEERAVCLKDLQPTIDVIKKQMIKDSSVPSVAYGLLGACGIEAYKLIDAYCDNKNYKLEFKTLLCNTAILAASLELVHAIRVKVA